MKKQLQHDDSDLEPSAFLVENLALLPRGRALDIAMGKGRNALYLARQGFMVEGVDISSESIQTALHHARETGVSLHARVADLENDFHIEPECYDVIIVFNYLQRSLFPDIKKGLKKNGIVVYETFTIDQPQFGRPTNPAFLLKHNELLERFRDLRCLRYWEGIFQNEGAKASIVAQKA
jgi:tellurite methyltransferase